jgi:hypothetical protein
MLSSPLFAQDSGSGDIAMADTTSADGEAEAIDPMEPRGRHRDLTLEEFQWVARPIIVFADTPADRAFGSSCSFWPNGPIR